MLRSLKTNGIELTYMDQGDGPAVVYVPGTSANADRFDAVGYGPALRSIGLRTIALNNRGIAPTDVPNGPYSVTMLADDTIGAIEELGLENVVLMGSSLGALVTQSVALRRPDLVAAVVLHIGGGSYPAWTRAWLASTVERLELGGEQASQAWQDNMLDCTLTPSQRHDTEAIEQTAAILDAVGFGAVSDFTGILAQMHANAEYAAEEHLTELQRLEPPVLFIAHELDICFSLEGMQAAAAAAPLSDIVVIEGVNHVALTPDASAASVDAVVRFVKSRMG